MYAIHISVRHAVICMFIHNSSWHLLRLLYKVSTPGDRTWIASRLPETLTWLEMRMPINWNTAVIHILLCCITKQMEAVGPLHSANLLDIERFQTVFKGLARGTADVMESILNHYVLLESTLSNRLTCDMDWANAALPSSIAGHIARFDSSDRTDSFCRGLGASTPYVLKSHEYKQVQTMWADEYPDYHSLHRKFNAARRSSGRARQCPSISLWKHASITRQEQKWQKMKPEVQVKVVVVVLLLQCIVDGIIEHNVYC